MTPPAVNFMSTHSERSAGRRTDNNRFSQMGNQQQIYSPCPLLPDLCTPCLRSPTLTRLAMCARGHVTNRVGRANVMFTNSLISHERFTQSQSRPSYAFVTSTLTSGVARICCDEGQSWKLGHGHSRRTSGLAAAADR